MTSFFGASSTSVDIFSVHNSIKFASSFLEMEPLIFSDGTQKECWMVVGNALYSLMDTENFQTIVSN